jgi:Flp pilus assembly pilin Flp
MLKSFTNAPDVWLRFWKDQSGQDLIEYSLIGALLAISCVAIMGTLATSLVAEFGLITAAL